MANETLVRRKPLPPDVADEVKKVEADLAGNGKAAGTEKLEHPGGDIKHNGSKQLLRLVLVILYFLSSCFAIVITQFLGVPLYWYNKDYYYGYMALTKQSFGIFVTTLTQWWSPTVVRISGDASVAGQIRKTPDGRVELNFPDRVVLMANHQIYSDWLYLWWAAYTNKPSMHGHIYIILKESLKYLPIVGQGMMFYGFIFMSRKMATDQPRIAHRLNKLKERHKGPLSGGKGLDPMWLLIFPEGTNASDNGRVKSAAWAAKTGVEDMKHTLLPRSTGSYFCLNELKDTVDFVYDCTLAYEGIPRGGFGEEYFTLRSMYLRGQAPPSVNMHWRKFAIKDIPLADSAEFDVWMRDRWYEKDALMEQYMVTGRFPGSAAINGDANDHFIETEVKLKHWYEVATIFMVIAVAGLVFGLAWKVLGLVGLGGK